MFTCCKVATPFLCWLILLIVHGSVSFSQCTQTQRIANGAKNITLQLKTTIDEIVGFYLHMIIIIMLTQQNIQLSNIVYSHFSSQFIAKQRSLIHPAQTRTKTKQRREDKKASYVNKQNTSKWFIVFFNFPALLNPNSSQYWITLRIWNIKSFVIKP